MPSEMPDSGTRTPNAAQATDTDLANEAEHTIPLSRTRAEEIAALRAWSRGRSVPASGAGNA